MAEAGSKPSSLDVVVVVVVEYLYSASRSASDASDPKELSPLGQINMLNC